VKAYERYEREHGSLNRFFLSEYFPRKLRHRIARYAFLSQSLLPQRILSQFEIGPSGTTLRYRVSIASSSANTFPGQGAVDSRDLLSSLNRFFLSEYFPSQLRELVLSGSEVSIASSSANTFPAGRAHDPRPYRVVRLNRFFLSEYFPRVIVIPGLVGFDKSLNRFFLSEYFPRCELGRPGLVGTQRLNRFFLSEYFPRRRNAQAPPGVEKSQSLLPQRILSQFANQSSGVERTGWSQSLLPQRILSQLIVRADAGAVEIVSIASSSANTFPEER